MLLVLSASGRNEPLKETTILQPSRSGKKAEGRDADIEKISSSIPGDVETEG